MDIEQFLLIWFSNIDYSKGGREKQDEILLNLGNCAGFC